jgi:WD40 repeat protein
MEREALHIAGKPFDSYPPSHMDDMTSVAFCSPNILATSSIDGRIVLWNLESGYIKLTLEDPFLDIRSKEEKPVEKVIFLVKESEVFANMGGLGVWPRVPLVSCHSDGSLRFWDIPEGNLVLEVELSYIINRSTAREIMTKAYRPYLLMRKQLFFSLAAQREWSGSLMLANLHLEERIRGKVVS